MHEDGGALRARIDAGEAIIHDPKDPMVGIPRPSQSFFGVQWVAIWNLLDFVRSKI